ncbi:MAG: hypothetical protein LBR53_06030 [Deltaproteobacteria bacterium]|jgi:hypothetical protein|nr:hypothetical protein [Deltaproteobacteria bacterium]
MPDPKDSSPEGFQTELRKQTLGGDSPPKPEEAPGGPSASGGREHQNPRYRGLYASGRHLTKGVALRESIHHGLASDLPTLYPEDLAPALAARSSLLEGIESLKRKKKRLGSRDLIRLGRLEGELGTIERRLTLHEKRARGSHLELAKSLGGGWEEYLAGLAHLVFFLEKSRENIGSLAGVLEDPGRSSKSVVRGLEDSLHRLLAGTRELMGEIVPPETLEPLAGAALRAAPEGAFSEEPSRAEGDPAAAEAVLSAAGKEASPPADFLTAKAEGAAEGPPQAPEGALGEAKRRRPLRLELPDPPPEKRNHKKLLSAAAAYLKSLERARLEAVDALLAAESEIARLGSGRGERAGGGKSPETTFIPENAPELPLKPVPPAPFGGSCPLPLSQGNRPEEATAKKRPVIRFLAAAGAGLLLALILYLGKSFFLSGEEKAPFHIFNGLGTPVTVNFPGGPAVLPPGGKFEAKIPRGRAFQIRTYINGRAAERLEAEAPKEDGTSLIYSVAGAAPFIEWLAHYGPEPKPLTEERSLGAPKIFYSQADVVLAMPPERVRAKSGSASLLALNPVSQAHPEIMLQDLSDSVKDRIVEAQARWNEPSELFLPLWLSYLAQRAPENALELLEDRMDDYPEDIWTIRTLLNVYPPDRRGALCDSLTEDALNFPEDADKAYLRVRCLKTREMRAQGYFDLLERFPDNPFLNRAAGLTYFEDGAYAPAYLRLKKAFYLEPRVMLADMDFLARLAKYENENTAVISSEIGPWSPHIRKLISLAGAPDGEFSPSTEEAFQLLENGDPQKAFETAPPSISPGLLYLCAASDGAPRSLVDMALEADPLEYLTVHNAWSALGLYLREGKDSTLVEGFILDNASDRVLALAALELVKKGNLDDLDAFMLGLDPWLQGKLALAVRVRLGTVSPRRYAETARGFLFTGERPYLER